MTAQLVRVTNASTAPRAAAGKHKLLWSSAAAVIAAAAIQPQAAHAQEAAPLGAFRGTITNEPANVSRGSMTTTTETITISAAKTVIDWSASQADFLPAGNVATFLGSGVSDFTVLNRISADGQQIQLNGSVLGRLQDQANAPAGKIWFYSPGGILVGATASFDVGGLVLTANDPIGFANSATGFGQFTADSESNAAVIISQGAQIAANPANSYVALIAPRVEQRGTVTVNGAAAYVAGQQLTMTLNQGLFDIAIGLGTPDGQGVVHSGVTTGPASTGASDGHQISMVAVPKNQAMTMLLGGSVGFADAVNAEVENGDIVLSSGGNLTIGSGTYSSDLLATASGNITVTNEMFASDLELRAVGTITTGDIEADGTFTALAHGNMSFGDVVADEVYLADYVAAAPGSGDLLGTCVGTCGTLGPNGVVTAPPGGTSYTYVTTNGGVYGAGQLPGEGGTNGSTYTTTPFSADAGDDLNFGFNYVTTDGSGYADYAWAALYTATLDPVAILYTARTQSSGTIVPGQDLPGVEATLNPSSVPIIPGGPQWAPLGSESGSCFSAGCGYTGWVSSTYEIATPGNYVLRFGVSNWQDSGYQSGMAFSGITVGGVPVEGAPLRTGGSISIGDVSTGSFTAAAGTTLTTGVIDSSGDIYLDAGGAILTNNLFAGALIIDGPGDAFTTQSTDAPSIEINSDTSVTTGTIDSAGDVTIRSDGWIEAGDIDAAGDVVATAGSDFLLADVLAGGSIALTAGGVAEFLGLVSAAEISVTSRDITIADGASLGEAGVTDLLTLIAVSDSPIIIGEYDSYSEGIQYRLDEEGDIESAKVVVTAAGIGDAAAPDIHIYDVEIEGSLTDEGDDGGVSHVEVNTAGSVVVNGLLVYSGAADTDVLEINAGESFQVNTSNGGRIAMIDNSEEPSGILELTAGHIWIGDQELLDALNEDVNFSGRDEALATNNGGNNPEGNVIAGGMLLTTGETLFVQNSGTDSDFAGLTIGAGELAIRSSGEQPVTVIAYGQRRNSNGTFTGGTEFFGQVDFGTDSGTQYAEGSKFNNCFIGATCAVPPPPPPVAGPESILGPVGLMNGPMAGGFGEPAGSESEAGEEESAESIAATLGLISTGGVSTELIIDEPVTSGSDSNQWNCPQGEESSTCESALDTTPGE